VLPDPLSANSPLAAGCPRPSPALPSLGAPVVFPGGLAQVPRELTPRTVNRLNNSARWSRSSASAISSSWSSRIEPPYPALNSFRCPDGHLHRGIAAPRSREPLALTYHAVVGHRRPRSTSFLAS
jgi:hypothetical protein